MAEMTPAQWESLCDGCGRCCLNKLEDADTGEIFYTDVACALLDLETCRCGNYENRAALVPDCVILTPNKVEELGWLPRTCSYRVLAETGDLPVWHPLRGGDAEAVHGAGLSVRGRACSETEAVDLEEHIVTWPA